MRKLQLCQDIVLLSTFQILNYIEISLLAQKLQQCKVWVYQKGAFLMKVELA